MKYLISLIAMSMLSFSAHAQDSRDDWSKKLKQPNLNIEGLTAHLASTFNKNKGEKLDSNAISLGATAVRRNIYIDNQSTNQPTESQIKDVKVMMPKIVSQSVCDAPVMYVLVKEHGITVSYRWFDKNMKELMVTLVDSKNC